MAPDVPDGPSNGGFQEVGNIESMRMGWNARLQRRRELATHSGLRPLLANSSVDVERNQEALIREHAEVAPCSLNHTYACNGTECTCMCGLIGLGARVPKLPEQIDCNDTPRLDRSYVPSGSEVIESATIAENVAEMADFLGVQAENAKGVTTETSNSGLYPRAGFFTPKRPLSRFFNSTHFSSQRVPEKYLIQHDELERSGFLERRRRELLRRAEPPSNTHLTESEDEDLTEDEWEEDPKGCAKEPPHGKG